ncbi:MAG: hypothetical protein ACRDYA_17460 [Egibacteraceae bacterium]
MVVGRWSDGLAGALRAALREGLDDFAVRLGVGTSAAGDWEDSPGIVPQAVNQRALDELLRRADDEARRRFDVLTRGDPLVRVADLSGLDGNGVGTDRRHVTKGAAAVGVVSALAPLEALERIAVQDRYPVDAGLVVAHEKFADALLDRELNPALRPHQLVGEVAGQAEELLALLDRPMAEADRRRLEAAAVGSCAHAGMLAFSRIGDRRVARGCFALARSVAEDSGDDVLRAQALGVGAILLSPMPGGGRGGDPRRQVTKLSEAVRYARGGDANTRASLQWWLAAGLAGKRDEFGFRRAVEVAERLADRVGATGAGGWLERHFACESDSQARDKNVGIGLLLLGQPGPAVEALAQALKGPRQGAWRVTLLIDTAAARVLQGEPEAACAGLLEALDLAERFGHGMGVRRIVGVRTRFRPEWAGLDCVRELDDRLRPAS